jgi:RimJ/RimL family protein N-acetyltransferase
VDDEAVGGIGFTLQQDVAFRSAEIGYWLGEEFWGRGIATEALKAVTEHAFNEYDLCRLYAHVFEWNQASARVLEKAGYEFEGRLRKSVTKDGKTIDQLMYAITRD